ncbi:NF038129 family PEP-CTERM protein [Iodobacter arcticus]|uniref:NF038129 family PEP-CTERM protein n=1 Tax=Iodobacter arcticus TaxID=590593 RepID=A0ABW2QVW4_9NEIS
MNHALKLALASLLLACSSMASAAIYHVDIDTTSLEGQGGFVALGLNGLSDSPWVRALVSQYRGASLGAVDAGNTFNAVGQLQTTLKLENTLPNQFTQSVVFGKKLQFNIEFEGNTAPLGSGTSFAFSLFDQSANALLSNDPSGAIVFAEFTPGQALDFKSLNAAATITPVPEPETYALLGLGLLGLGLQHRRRSNLIKMA